MPLSEDDRDMLRAWNEEGFRRLEKKFDSTTRRLPKQPPKWRKVAIGVALTFLTGAMAWAGKGLVSQAARLIKVEVTQQHLQEDVADIKKKTEKIPVMSRDVRAIKETLDRYTSRRHRGKPD